MKFYSPSEFRKLNESSDIKDFYIQVDDWMSNTVIEVLDDTLGKDQYTFDGLNFFSFGNEEDAKSALKSLVDKRIEIIDSNLETDVIDDEEINEDFQSKILADLENNFKNNSNSWKPINFYKTLRRMGIDVSRVTDEDITKIAPEEIFKKPYKENNNVVIAVNSDPEFKQMLLDTGLLSSTSKAAKDNLVLIGLFKNGASINFSGSEEPVGVAAILEEAKGKWNERTREKIIKAFSVYLTRANNKGLSKMFGEDKVIDFTGALNKGNIVQISTEAYAISAANNPVSDLVNKRSSAKKGARALMKPEDILSNNKARYKKIITENVSISEKVKELFESYNQLVNDVIASEDNKNVRKNRDIYNALDNVSSSFSSAIRYMSEYYSYMNSAKGYESKGDDYGKYERKSAIDSKQRFVEYMKEFYIKRDYCIKILESNEGSIQN